MVDPSLRSSLWRLTVKNCTGLIRSIATVKPPYQRDLEALQINFNDSDVVLGTLFYRW